MKDFDVFRLYRSHALISLSEMLASFCLHCIINTSIFAGYLSSSFWLQLSGNKTDETCFIVVFCKELTLNTSSAAQIMPFSSACKDLSCRADNSWYLSNCILSWTVHLPSAFKTSLATLKRPYPTVTFGTEQTPSNTDVELPVALLFSVGHIAKAAKACERNQKGWTTHKGNSRGGCKSFFLVWRFYLCVMSPLQ